MPPYPAAPYPYPSVPQPQPGWGGWGLPQQRGWGGFGWGVPPAPQPGVIPLRPLTVGEILQGAARAARRHWRTMAGLLAAIGVLSGITGLAYDAVSIGDHTFNGHRHRLSGHELDHLLTFGGIAGGCELLLVVLGVIATAVFTGVFARSALGQPSDWRGAWGQARPRLGAVCGITLLLIAIAVGFPLLGAVPGIVVAAVGGPVAGAVGLSVLGVFLGLIPAARLLVLYSLSIQTCVLEKHGVRRSLSRSASLVRGSWWRVFGIQLLGGLLVTLVRSLINVPFVAVGLAIFGVHLHTTAGNPDVTFFASYSWGQAVLSAIGTAIGAALTSQYVSGVTSFLYMDQRIRRESLDVELARAAGVPGYSA
jgi:hypothetical protein